MSQGHGTAPTDSVSPVVGWEPGQLERGPKYTVQPGALQCLLAVRDGLTISMSPPD